MMKDGFHYFRRAKGFFEDSPPLTQFDIDQALESLLKESVWECKRCDGLGQTFTINVGLTTDRPFYIQERFSGLREHSEISNVTACPHCSGHGIVCAWCHQGVEVCSCGGD